MMVAGSLLIHATFVGVAALRPQKLTVEEPDQITQIIDQPGEEVQQLIVKDEPSPPPDVTPEPTPPMPDVTPEPDTPPPSEDPDMAEPEKPTPTPHPHPPSRVTPPPANAKRGPVAQPGQVDGNVQHSTNLTGKPGGGHWSTPTPGYPYQARASHVTGSGSVRISTNGSGEVISASMASSTGNGILDATAISAAKSRWHGPPNATTTVPITFKLQ